MRWEQKSIKKKVMSCKIAFFAIAQLKIDVEKSDLRLAEMRWEIDVAELSKTNARKMRLERSSQIKKAI